MNRTVEWEVVSVTSLSVLSIVPRHCARLTYVLHPTLRNINVVLIARQLITVTLRRLRCAGSVPCRPTTVNEARVTVKSLMLGRLCCVTLGLSDCSRATSSMFPVL